MHSVCGDGDTRGKGWVQELFMSCPTTTTSDIITNLLRKPYINSFMYFVEVFRVERILSRRNTNQTNGKCVWWEKKNKKATKWSKVITFEEKSVKPRDSNRKKGGKKRRALAEIEHVTKIDTPHNSLATCYSY